MIKKLSKYGNSWALLIDKPILDLLKIDESTKLQISTDGTCLIIKPIVIEEESGNLKDEKLKKLFKEFVTEYAPALKKLSDN